MHICRIYFVLIIRNDISAAVPSAHFDDTIGPASARLCVGRLKSRVRTVTLPKLIRRLSFVLRCAKTTHTHTQCNETNIPKHTHTHTHKRLVGATTNRWLVLLVHRCAPKQMASTAKYDCIPRKRASAKCVQTARSAKMCKLLLLASNVFHSARADIVTVCHLRERDCTLCYIYYTYRGAQLQ